MNIQTPKPVRDYTNLPLAAIPESKESMLEDNSGLQTALNYKLGSVKNSCSVPTSEVKEKCSCC